MNEAREEPKRYDRTVVLCTGGMNNLFFLLSILQSEQSSLTPLSIPRLDFLGISLFLRGEREREMQHVNFSPILFPLLLLLSRLFSSSPSSHERGRTFLVRRRRRRRKEGASLFLPKRRRRDQERVPFSFPHSPSFLVRLSRLRLRNLHNRTESR